jgi:hypothetical protein
MGEQIKIFDGAPSQAQSEIKIQQFKKIAKHRCMRRMNMLYNEIKFSQTWRSYRKLIKINVYICLPHCHKERVSREFIGFTLNFPNYEPGRGCV